MSNRRTKKFFSSGEFGLTSIFLVSVLLSASVVRCFVSPMRDFLEFNRMGTEEKMAGRLVDMHVEVSLEEVSVQTF